MGSIDRVRYYDGEFLRAFDFGDEQTYHMEMRRRLNRYLHRYGIAQGLLLTEDIEAGIHQVSIPPGLAIDAFGREIYLFAPYTFGDADITANRIASAGAYDVWLRYNKSASTPPSAGYSQCNQTNQYTRWMESFSVVLLQSPSNPFTPPAFTDDDTDNPSEDQVGVLLGTVSVDPSSATAQFASPQLHRRHFLGIFAQSIQTPPGYSAVSAFNFPARQSAWNPPISLEIEPNIFARQNLILGPDFDLTTTTGGVAITTTPAATTSPSGSAKLAGDLFVQGNVYSFVPDPVKPQWLGLSAYVKQLAQQGMPDFVATAVPVAITPPNPAPSPGSFTVTAPAIAIPSKLTSMSNVVASASIGGIEFNTPASMNQVGVFINSVSGSPGANQCTVSVTYTITGVIGTATPILTFYVSASAVCYP
ncbi:MAG TPA: hypothetical protein VGG72_25600 [Bryobacteraceae bacterium]